MSYDVAILPVALKQLWALPKRGRQRIRDRIDALAEEPRPAGGKALKGGEGYLRPRVGDYRIVRTAAGSGQDGARCHPWERAYNRREVSP